MLDHRSHALTLHLNNLLGIGHRAENGRHLCMSENEIDLGVTHSIVESDSRHFVMHAGKLDLRPLRSILTPDADEAPHFTFSLNFRAEV